MNNSFKILENSFKEHSFKEVFYDVVYYEKYSKFVEEYIHFNYNDSILIMSLVSDGEVQSSSMHYNYLFKLSNKKHFDVYQSGGIYKEKKKLYFDKNVNFLDHEARDLFSIKDEDKEYNDYLDSTYYSVYIGNVDVKNLGFLKIIRQIKQFGKFMPWFDDGSFFCLFNTLDIISDNYKKNGIKRLNKLPQKVKKLINIKKINKKYDFNEA